MEDSWVVVQKWTGGGVTEWLTSSQEYEASI